MRTLRALRFAWIPWLALVQPAAALERTPAPAPDRDGEWRSGGALTFSYYNTCTGWSWVWSDWQPGETVSVSFDVSNYSVACGEYNYLGELQTTWMATQGGVPSGYGYTGTISAVYGGPCGTPLTTQPFNPPVTSGWSATNWGGPFIGTVFSIQIRWGAPEGFLNPAGILSDRPMAGPTGPDACGTCYPTTRVSNSKYLGVDGAYCPAGVGLNDGLCDAELLLDVVLGCVGPVGLENTTWGRLKTLYR